MRMVGRRRRMLRSGRPVVRVLLVRRRLGMASGRSRGWRRSRTDTRTDFAEGRPGRRERLRWTEWRNRSVRARCVQPGGGMHVCRRHGRGWIPRCRRQCLARRKVKLAERLLKQVVRSVALDNRIRVSRIRPLGDARAENRLLWHPTRPTRSRRHLVVAAFAEAGDRGARMRRKHLVGLLLAVRIASPAASGRRISAAHDLQRAHLGRQACAPR